MGVIDLNARVTALEDTDSTVGAVIDQIEAAVTALEETVNGNGDTDLGLVGDVAALEEALPNDKTLVLASSTASSTKKFAITVIDNGTISATEITE